MDVPPPDPSGIENRRKSTVSLVGVVDDDESVRVAISSLIRSAGHECITFASAEDLLQSSQLSITSCVVLDVRLPGMSGVELQLRLRQMGCSIPVILITANPDDQLQARVLKAGAAVLLGKPFSAEALLSEILKLWALLRCERGAVSVAL